MKDEHLSRLKWRCRRGMRELDVMLSRYFDDEYPASDPEHKEAFEILLTLQDPEILDLLTGRVIAEDRGLQHVVQRLLTND